jgi:hypothetical protein
MNRLHFPSALLILVAVVSAAFAKGSPPPPSISITGPTNFGSVMPHRTAILTLTITTSGYLSATSVARPHQIGLQRESELGLRTR